ncbi:hypothetical protein [Saccharomonospora xinjiangensis]|uniref:hypothetical protein n=1 Tax=Saccharomonospora xinjiangensis TaxID=75294 RepID=UPI00350FF525
MIIGMSFTRTVALSLAGVVTTLAALATPATAAEPPAEFDFSDCPELPSGADPAQWRCEVLVSTATLSFGALDDVHVRPMRLTFAERWTGGPYEQEFGALRSEPTPLPGLPATTVSFRYGGYSDFQSDDERKGEIDLVAALDGPLLPRDCAIGTQADPIHSVLKQTGPTEVVSNDPLVLRFATIDDQLAMPAVSGCGPWRRMLDHRLGLPSASGDNVLEQETYVAIRHYG